MKQNLFLGVDNSVLIASAVSSQTEANTSNKRKPKSFWLIIVILLAATATFSYVYKVIKQTYEISKTVHNVQKLRFEQLKAKVQSETLTEEEWDELCKLLAEVDGITVNDCENCRNYIKALLEIKHYKHLKNYEQCTDKELLKGIKKYQRRIDEHLDKIANPKKYFPDWDSFHPNKKEDLVNSHWPNDIKRLKEQKEILECILKNR